MPKSKIPAFSRKKSRFSGKNDLEAREVHDLVVGLDLGEVGPRRRVQDEAGPRLPLEVRARPRHEVVGGRPVGARRAGQAAEAERPELDVGRLSRQAAEAREVTGAAHPGEPSLGARPGAPQRVLVAPAHDPLDVEAPDLLALRARVAEAAERDRELRRPALRHAPRGDAPDRPPVDVERRALVRDEGVELGPVRVRGEEEGVAVVVERVEGEGDDVVAREPRGVVEPLRHHRVTLEDPADDRLRLAVSREDADEERVVVVDDPHLGRLAGGLALARLALAEAGGERRLPPRGVVEDPVDARGRRRPRPREDRRIRRRRRTETPRGEELPKGGRGLAHREHPSRQRPGVQGELKGP